MQITRRQAIIAAAGAAALTQAGLAGAALAQTAPGAMAPTETGMIAVPGGKVWYRRVGSGRKPPLLLLHGGPGAGHDYLLPMAALADERPVIFYDQLGTGRSDAPEDEKLYHIERFVEEVDAVRAALGLHEIMLFGNSWGSMLAIEYMIRGHGKGVEKLVLSGAIASVPQAVAGMQRLIDALPEGKAARLRALEAAGQQASPEYLALVQLFYDRHLFRGHPVPPEMVATTHNLEKSPAYRIMNGPNEFTIVGTIKDWERRPDLGRITVPTLITTGEFDEVTLDCHQSIKAGIKGADLVVMPGCSHLTMLEQPAAYNAIVRHFIA